MSGQAASFNRNTSFLTICLYIAGIYALSPGVEQLVVKQGYTAPWKSRFYTILGIGGQKWLAAILAPNFAIFLPPLVVVLPLDE
eukprot:311950-Amphidinium_carterae.1